MSYQSYVIAAYMVFAIALLWDWVAPRIQLKQQLRAAKSRAARAGTPTGKDAGSPLSRE
jgi:heme exporter protein D